MNHDQNGAQLMMMLHNRIWTRAHVAPPSDARYPAPGASPYVDKITLSPDESGIYDAFGSCGSASKIATGRVDLFDRLAFAPGPPAAQWPRSVAMSPCCRCPAKNVRPRGAGTKSTRGGRCRYCPRRSRRTPRWRASADPLPRSPGSAGDDDCRAYGFGHLQVIAGPVLADRPWRL